MKIRAFALALVVASACGTGSETTVAPADTSAPSSTAVTITFAPTTTAAPTTGPGIDALVEKALADDAFGELGISESELRCAVTIVADSGEHNRSELLAGFSSDEPLRPFLLRLVFEALDQCADLRTVMATTFAPEFGSPVDLLVCVLEQISDETLMDALVAFALEADLDAGDPALAEFEQEIEAIPPTACSEEEAGFPLGKPTSHVLNGDPADLEAVAFNPMNATIPDLSFCGDVEFVNSRSWSGPLDPEAYSTDSALIDYFVVAEVVAESPGPEVIITVYCASPGTYWIDSVYVFAGHTEETIVLGEPIHGSLESISDESGVVVAARAWQVADPHCCPTQFKVSEHHWEDNQWVQSWVQYWTLDGQVLDEPLPQRWAN